MRVGSRDMHGNIFGSFGIHGAAKRNDHTHTIVHVRVMPDGCTRHPGHAADLDVFAQFEHLVRCHLRKGMSLHGRLFQGLNRVDMLGQSGLNSLINKLCKGIILADEVCFAVDLNHHGLGSCPCGNNTPFMCGALALASRLGQSFFTQILNGRFEVAVGFFEGFFARHHTHAGAFPQFFYGLC